ncbi:MAG: transporter substrate-binding domain-containing protein [Xanthomonadales bacterium]|nr:transporter substrate-binding domain-containing protein [Xanthomonadales bacterium]
MRPLFYRPLLLLLACLVSCALLATSAMAATPSVPANASSTLIVGVTAAPPFVIPDGESYRGLGIDLWQETAADHHWQYRYQTYDLDGLLKAVSSGQIDVAIGAITTTAEREKRMDFAHPVTSSGLGIAVRNTHSAGWLAVASALLSSAFLKVIGTLALLLLIVGFLVWLAEHKNNPEQFGGSRAHGIFSGFWWAMVTMTTVGYGDVAPRSVPGRILGLVWMLAALIVVSFFTASITAALTVGQLSHRIQSASDLASVRIGSVAASTSSDWLQRNHVSFASNANLDAALKQLAANKVDAVVFDAPLLRWKIKQHYSGKLTVLPIRLERQDYAYALPTDSPLREGIDTSLLKRINSPDWSERLAKYFGPAE